MKKNRDEEILQEIGLSDLELRGFLHKLKAFAGTLTPAERKVLRANLSDCEEAVETFNISVTQMELRKFIKLRQPDCEDFTCCVNGTGNSTRKTRPE